MATLAQRHQVSSSKVTLLSSWGCLGGAVRVLRACPPSCLWTHCGMGTPSSRSACLRGWLPLLPPVFFVVLFAYKGLQILGCLRSLGLLVLENLKLAPPPPPPPRFSETRGAGLPCLGLLCFVCCLLKVRLCRCARCPPDSPSDQPFPTQGVAVPNLSRMTGCTKTRLKVSLVHLLLDASLPKQSKGCQ